MKTFKIWTKIHDDRNMNTNTMAWVTQNEQKLLILSLWFGN